MRSVIEKLRRYLRRPSEASADVGGLAVLGWKHARRLVILVVGGSVVLFGIVAAFLPVIPGVLIVPLGLAILATEFVWARRLLKRAKLAARGLGDSIRGRPGRSNGGAGSVENAAEEQARLRE